MNDNNLDENNEIKNEYEVEYIDEFFNKKIKSYKVIIIGNSGVGKTCISFRAMNNTFNEELPETVGFDVSNFQVKVNEKIIQIQLWDTCGSEEYAINTPNLFKNTSIGIIVYAINNRASFKDISSWNNFLNNYNL